MNKPIIRAFSVGTLAACLFAMSFATVAVSKPKPPQYWDGLELRKVKGIDAVYVRPGVQFTPYKSVVLEPTKVEFSKDWQNSFDFSNRPNAADMQRIREKLAELMRERFTLQLVNHGYTVLETSAEDTLEIRTAIIDLFVNAPDTRDSNVTRTYTTSAGRMTLVLEAHDGPTGQLLARVVDGRSDDTMGGMMTWTNSATNTHEATKIIDDWARDLREALDRLNGKEPKK